MLTCGGEEGAKGIIRIPQRWVDLQCSALEERHLLGRQLVRVMRAQGEDHTQEWLVLLVQRPGMELEEGPVAHTPMSVHVIGIAGVLVQADVAVEAR